MFVLEGPLRAAGGGRRIGIAEDFETYHPGPGRAPPDCLGRQTGMPANFPGRLPWTPFRRWVDMRRITMTSCGRTRRLMRAGLDPPHAVRLDVHIVQEAPTCGRRAGGMRRISRLIILGRARLFG